MIKISSLRDAIENSLRTWRYLAETGFVAKPADTCGLENSCGLCQWFLAQLGEDCDACGKVVDPTMCKRHFHLWRRAETPRERKLHAQRITTLLRKALKKS